MQKKDYFIFGTFFLALEILVIIRNTLISYNFYLWFCDFAPLLLAITFFLRKNNLIKAVINFGLITQLIFLLWYLKDIIQNMPDEKRILFEATIIILTIIIHASTLMALIFTRKIKPNIRTVYWTIGVIISIWLVTIIFTNPADNINFVYQTPSEITLFIPLQKFLWLPIVFFIFAMPAHYIQFLLYKHALSKKGKEKTKSYQ